MPRLCLRMLYPAYVPHRPSIFQSLDMARRTASRKVASLRSRTPEPTVPLQCEVYVVTSHNRTRRVSITHQDITSETRHECTVRGVYTSAITAKAAAENWLDGHDLRGWDREDWQEGGGRTWWDLIIRSQTSSKIAILTVERCMLHDVPINGHDSSADDEGGKDQAIEISSGSSDSIDDQDVDGVGTSPYLGPFQAMNVRGQGKDLLVLQPQPHLKGSKGSEG